MELGKKLEAYEKQLKKKESKEGKDTQKLKK